MNIEILKTLGAVAGIGGIALGVLLIIFRDVIRKNIFPTLGKTHAYQLLRLIIILAFSAGVLGVIAYVILSLSEGQRNRVRVTDVAISVEDGLVGPRALYWHTQCPVEVRLTGSISAVGEGPVTYKFFHKMGLDGVEVPSQTMSVDFDGPSKTIPVTGKVTVTFPEGEYYFTAYLKIADPGDRQSEPVGFTVLCDPTAEPAPYNPPPLVEPP